MESRTGDPGGSADAFAGARGRDEDAAARDEAARRRTGPARREPTPRPRRSRIVFALVLVLILAVGGYGVSTLGPVRTLLRQSFTDQTKPTVDFYFNGAPYVSGEWLQVPLGVLNAPRSGTYAVRLWIVDATGKVLSTGTAKLGYAQGHGAVNVNLLLHGSGQIVFARLVGTSLTVHYRYEGSPLGTASPSASRKG